MTNEEINKKMAEFMGWYVFVEDSDGTTHISDNQFTYFHGHEKNPCESISDAWMLVKKAAVNNLYIFELEFMPGATKPYKARFTFNLPDGKIGLSKPFVDFAESDSLAICKAVEKVMEG